MTTMESSADEEKMISKPLLDEEGPKRGGLRTIPFILANESFERVASSGLQPNMIFYLMKVYHMEMATGSNLIFLWSAASNLMALPGAILADSLLGRFWTVGFGSIFTLLGIGVLWLTTMIPQVRPPPCTGSSSICRSATTFQLFLVCSSFGLMSIGAGGIKSSSSVFGADQLRKEEDHKNEKEKNDPRTLELFISCYNAVYTLSFLVALSGIVYLQDKMGWQIGFSIPAVLMFFSVLSFFLASPFYVKLKPKSSLVTGMIKVAVASCRKRNTKAPSESSSMFYHQNKGSVLIPSEKLRFLNKACMIVNPQQDLTTDGRATNPWSLCTVDQVEELKMLLKVIPLWSTGVLMSMTVNQGSFLVLQASSMNRKLGSSFEIPAGSFGLFSLIAVILWIAIYYPIILPIASKVIGKPAHLSAKQRMGIGILVSFLAMVVTATVETIRRGFAIREGYSDDPNAVVDMSAMWLIPQHFLNGLGAGIYAIAQLEFYYSEFPRSMSSIANTLGTLGESMASLVASFIMSTVDNITKSGGKQSWISSNINQGHYDYYYFVLSGLSLLNMIYFLACCKAYGPCKGEQKEIHDREDGLEEQKASLCYI